MTTPAVIESSVLFCSMLNTLLSNDLDTEDQNIYNMEGFLDFRDFEAYAYGI